MLDRQLMALLEGARAAGAPDLCELPVPAARGLYRQILSASGSKPDAMTVRDLRIPGAAAGEALGVRLYTPRGDGVLPVVLWLHGGGYALGDLDGYDGVCRQLAIDAQAAVVAVDYRLAPEHPYPAAFDDAWVALRWVASPAGADALGPDADPGRLAVAGDSAGASRAIAAAIQARDAGGPRIAFQALAYPPAACGRAGDFASRKGHAAGPTLTSRAMDYFNAHAFGAAGQAPDARAAVPQAESLAGLPPTYLTLAAFDPLRDEGFALGRRLAEAGNELTLVEYHGLAHGFIAMGAAVQAARWAQRQFGEALRDGLHS
jgi:acetyl esterase